MDEEQTTHHAGFLSHLTTRQKLIGGGVLGVVALGLYTAHRSKVSTAIQTATSDAPAQPTQVQSVPVYVPINVPATGTAPVTGTTPTNGGVGTPSAGGVGTPSAGGVGTTPINSSPTPGGPMLPTSGKDGGTVTIMSAPTPTPAPIAAPVITITRSAPIVLDTTAGAQFLTQQDHLFVQAQQPGATGAAAKAQLQSEPPVVVPQNAANSTLAPSLGFGGGNAATDGASVAAGIALNEQKIANDSAFNLSERERTAQVIANRQSVGLSTADQVAYEKHLEQTPIPQNAANTNARPALGFGGADYNTASADVQAGIVQNEQKLANDSSFVQSELSRTQNVIQARQADGLDTSAQKAYLSHVQSIAATDGIPSTTGAPTTRTPPGPPAAQIAYGPSWADEKYTDPAAYQAHIQQLTATFHTFKNGVEVS